MSQSVCQLLTGTNDETFVFGSVSCRGCGVPVTSDNYAIWVSYWHGMKFLAHRECVKEGMRQEAIDCQTIDADCNDCKHFQRGQRRGKSSSDGICAKTGLPTIANVNFCSGHLCFEHRRS